MEFLAGVAGLFVLAIIIVICSGSFSPKDQNWTTILAVAAGIPVFLVIVALLVK